VDVSERRALDSMVRIINREIARQEDVERNPHDIVS
jgi:hypothetical protein